MMGNQFRISADSNSAFLADSLCNPLGQAGRLQKVDLLNTKSKALRADKLTDLIPVLISCQ